MKIKLLKMQVDLINIKTLINQVYHWCSIKGGHYICVSSVHMCMETFDDQSIESAVNNADITVPDGKPLVWGQKLLGYKEAEQIRGQDLTMALCQLASDKKLKVGFYGASLETLLAMSHKLEQKFPLLDIAYLHSPPFRPLSQKEDNAIVNDIQEKNIDILFVGLGCPKQEHWMANHQDRLMTVMVGVGAAFDFIAGNKKPAPRWMQSIGLEWFFRLLCEPRRLWQRYLKQNPRFVYHFSKQILNKS